MVKILDCTLRDGGYVNEWNFGAKKIKKILQGLADSKVDIIECGFLSSKAKFTSNESRFSSVSDMEKLLPEAPNAFYVCMVNYSEYAAEDLPEYSGGKMEGIRLAFHKKDLLGAEKFARTAIEKGYKLFYQPMVTLNYSQEELTALFDSVNKLKPYAAYIVDSFGSMNPDQVEKYFEIFNREIDGGVKLGLHAHNNLQLAYSNALRMYSVCGGRDIIIDSSVYGMGRGAGNLCTELITSYLNKNFGGNYNDTALLQIVDECLMPIYTFSPWGYSIPYYISAMRNCHPNYASFLMNKQTLRVREISKIIAKIPEENYCDYDKKLIARLYTEFQSQEYDDKKDVAKLSKSLKGKSVLVLAPGRSISEYGDVIESKIRENNFEVVSVNFIPKHLKCNYVFVGNNKRLNMLDAALLKDCGAKLITTSNLEKEGNININYLNLINTSLEDTDNSGMMCLRLLKKCGVKKISLAGFDGFDVNNSLNFVDSEHVLNIERQYFDEKTSLIRKQIGELKKEMDIEFITPSLYE